MSGLESKSRSVSLQRPRARNLNPLANSLHKVVHSQWFYNSRSASPVCLNLQFTLILGNVRLPFSFSIVLKYLCAKSTITYVPQTLLHVAYDTRALLFQDFQNSAHSYEK